MLHARDRQLPLSKRGLALVGAALVFGGLALLIPFLSATPAGAIATSQYACFGGLLSITPTDGYKPYGPAVHINNGTAAHTNVELTFSADADVSLSTEMRMSWSIDGAAPVDYQYGPGNLAEHQDFDGTRTVVDVAGLGPGLHSIQPEVRISGGSGTSGTVLRACTLAQRMSN